MVLEAILYFILGFLSAALLALMISPAIWNRAVVITKRKIESTVPLTLNELQADKDQLRAEFAMSTRRLEMSVDKLKEKASAQLIEINRRRDEVNRLNTESKDRVTELSRLEGKSSQLSATLEERENKLTDLLDKHTRLQEQHDNLLEETDKLRSKFSTSEQTVKTHEIELTANKATIEALKGTVATIDMSENQQVEKIGSLQEQVTKLKDRLSEQKKETAEAVHRAKESEADLRRAKKALETSAKKASTLQSSSSERGQSIAELTTELIDEKAKTVELEARLARQALQTEALLNDASNENVQEALRSLNQDLEEKSAIMQSIRDERDQLAQQLEALKTATTQDWDDERQGQAFLRQQINDLATKVATMTAKFEGDDSKIALLLEQEEAEAEQSGEALTLADRIRAVQNATNIN